MNYDWNQKYNYNFPTLVRFGNGVIEELGPHLKEQGLKKVLVVSDPGLVKLPVFEKVVDMIKKAGVQVAVFSEIAKNPVKSKPVSISEVMLNGLDEKPLNAVQAIAQVINRKLYDYP